MNLTKPHPIVRPPLFHAPADGCRMLFDYGNEILLTNQVTPDLLFIGDSITQLWDVHAYFCDLGFPVNRGIGGDTAGVVSARFAADALQLAPRRIIVMIGINDVFALGSAGCPTEPDELTEHLTACYRSILEQAAKHRVPLYFGSVLPVRVEEAAKDATANGLILRLNKILSALCCEYGAHYLDYHQALTEPGAARMRAEFSHDGVHPHVLGYNRMAPVLREALR